mmetsp:Transcript_16748/g.27550  ORF Transcript_16748/g.27550 Transcript_16748/m.27550 type:complete len:621 (+) Transcript_16748:135-1997(+)
MGTCSSSTENDLNATVIDNNNVNQADLAAQAIGGSNSMVSRIELSLSCSNLSNTDRGSLTDAFAVIYLKSARADDQWREVGRTEIIANNLNPGWVKMIQLMYKFEEVQKILVEVYNVQGDFHSSDASSLDLQAQLFHGRAETTVAQIVGGHNQTWKAVLTNPEGLAHQRAELTCKAEEVANQNDNMQLFLAAEDVRYSGRAAFFLRYARLSEDGSLNPVYRSEVKFGKAPVWDGLTASLQHFVNGDKDRPLKVELWQHRPSGAHELLGAADTSVNGLLAAKAQGQPLAVVPSGGGGGGGLAARLVVQKCEVIHVPSFLDYIRNGTEMAFVAAIDFTGSNGEPSMPDSLHHLDPSGRLNPYASAITAIGSVLEHYDDDKLFPTYGFGAKPQPGAVTEHCFAVNGNEGAPDCEGVQGILEAYYGCLQRVQLHGPTLFAPIINQTAAMARSRVTNDPSNQTYHVLVILTDGIINDMENTKQAIVNAAALPLSIIIIGVGNADFEAMEVLDGDNERVTTATGQRAKRDVVQFVPMNKFINADAYDLAREVRSGFYDLAREVLDEVPRQLLEYMFMNGIRPPNAPPQYAPQGPREVTYDRQSSAARTVFAGGAAAVPIVEAKLVA